MVNGDIVQNPMYIGWINHLMKTEYTFAKRYAIWANVEEYAVERRDYDRPFSQSDLFDIVPKYLIKYAGGTELADVLYVIFGTETLEAADVIEGTYPFDILKCKNAIKRAIDFYGKKKAYDYISEIARMNSEGRRSIVNKYLNSIAECSLYMPARVLVYLMCELLGKSFWKEWAEFRSDIYKDEVVKKYASEELEKYREEGRIKPINSITTSEFLKNDEPFIFMDTPKELQDEPDYYISDADRLYWWDDSDEVLIDEKTKEWISEIVDEYKDALKEEADSFDSQMFVKEIIELLYEINERYKRVFAFQDMFYEFIANGTKKEYHAAIKVLRKQYDKNAKTAEVVAKAGGWNLNNKNVTCNKGRMNMKRYLSLLANKKLRKKYLYF